MEDVSRREKGITLIALVITIIVLLILAGVTINLTIGERGIFTTAQRAAQNYTVASEKEYLQEDVLEYQMQEIINGEEHSKIGVMLCDKTAENGGRWDIIQVKDDNDTTYGTGWNYIEKGSDLANYGSAKYNWLVNYETGEIINIEEKKYNHLSFNETVAVTDGLVFCYDSANVNSSSESFGENSKLYYYDTDLYGTSNNLYGRPLGNKIVSE